MTVAGRVVASFYHAVINRDFAAARKHLKDDLEFKGLFKTYHSADEYISDLTLLLGITMRVDVKRIISEGDEVAIFFEMDTQVPAEGKTLVAEYHHIEDGKIAYMESAFDGRPFAAMFT